jgi:hypothetical protein
MLVMQGSDTPLPKQLLSQRREFIPYRCLAAHLRGTAMSHERPLLARRSDGRSRLIPDIDIVKSTPLKG